MSKAKTFYVEAAPSKNFQKYTVGYTVELEDGDDVYLETKKWQAKARKRAREQLEVL